MGSELSISIYIDPEFLLKPETEWPVTTVTDKVKDANLELIKYVPIVSLSASNTQFRLQMSLTVQTVKHYCLCISSMSLRGSSCSLPTGEEIKRSELHLINREAYFI